jgi:hypothetical protein
MSRHIEGIAVAVIIGALLVARYWRRLTTHPYARCVFCLKRPGRNSGSKPDAYGRCFWCHGSRERLKFMSWLLRRRQIRGGR